MIINNWFKLPLALRQRWWRETDYGRLAPSVELIAAIQETTMNGDPKDKPDGEPKPADAPPAEEKPPVEDPPPAKEGEAA